MKTPRDLLLARHQTAVPQLDAIRREVVAGLNQPDTKEQSPPNILVGWFLGASNTFWQEVVWPCRRIWTGLATVWILIFIINFTQHDSPGNATGKSAQSGDVLMSLQVQQRWVAELLADRLAPPEADRPRNSTPKPRTQRSEIATL
jgi:hypothetical protein